jgi:uncharacterized HAD superfamily protein
MRIGIDMDDTITNSYDSVLDLVGLLYKKDMSDYKKRAVTYHEIIADTINFPSYRLVTRNYIEKIMVNIPLKENSKNVINRLHSEGHEIIIISARNSIEYTNPYATTHNYLIKNDIAFDKIIVDMVDKGEVCKEEKIDLFIDDDVLNCNSAIKAGINTLLFDNVFNKENKDIQRVNNWGEVYSIVTGL